MLLVAFKLAYPKAVHLNRGNHEDPLANQFYGFADEVEQKCPDTLKDFQVRQTCEGARVGQSCGGFGTSPPKSPPQYSTVVNARWHGMGPPKMGGCTHTPSERGTPVQLAEAGSRAEFRITTRALWTCRTMADGQKAMTAVGQARPEPNADAAT